jgi:hypothetical protein
MHSIQLRPVDPQAPLVNIKLEWPKFLRQGDSSKVRLELELREDGSDFVLEGNGDSKNAANLDSAPEGYNVVAEARLEMNRLPVIPTGEIIQPIGAGQPGEFLWRIQAVESGDYPGTVWVHLRLVPQANFKKNEADHGTRQPLTARPVDIRVVNFLGLEGWTTRVIGVVGSVLGLILVSDLIYVRVISNA